MLLLTLALTWMSVALGLKASTPEGADIITRPIQFGPFLSSAFVDPGTMPAGVGWMAEHQPFPPVIDTLRGLPTGTPIGTDAVWAVGWCALLTVVGYVWARAGYQRVPAAR